MRFGTGGRLIAAPTYSIDRFLQRETTIYRSKKGRLKRLPFLRILLVQVAAAASAAAQEKLSTLNSVTMHYISEKSLKSNRTIGIIAAIFTAARQNFPGKEKSC